MPEGVESLDLRYARTAPIARRSPWAALLLVLLALGTLVLRVATPRPASGAAPCGPGWPWVVPVAGVSALGLVGGWWGLAARGRRRSCVGPGSPLGGRTVGGVGRGVPSGRGGSSTGWRPLGSADGWAGALVLPQLLVAVALGALVAADARLARPGSRSRERRALHDPVEAPLRPPGTAIRVRREQLEPRPSKSAHVAPVGDQLEEHQVHAEDAVRQVADVTRDRARQQCGRSGRPAGRRPRAG